MTMFNYFRKRYFSFLLSLLVLHISCNPNQEQDSLIEEPLTIEQYVDNHVSLTFDLIEIFEAKTVLISPNWKLKSKFNLLKNLKLFLRRRTLGLTKV